MFGGRGPDELQAIFLERDVVVGIHAVNSQHTDPRLAFKQPQDEVGADEPGSAGNDNFHHFNCFPNVLKCIFESDFSVLISFKDVAGIYLIFHVVKA